jgi:hypothetical protein
MFTEFKQFYAKLFAFLPEIQRTGRHAYLHRARVAREDGDVKAFRELRNELINYWNMYLESEEAKKEEMNERLCQMLDADTYPSSETELDPSSNCLNAQSNSPVSLDIDGMTNDGIPMQSNYTPYRSMQIQGQNSPHTNLNFQVSQWTFPPGQVNVTPSPVFQQGQQSILPAQMQMMQQEMMQRQMQQQMQIAARNTLAAQQAALNTTTLFPSSTNGESSSSSSSSSSAPSSKISSHPVYPFMGSDLCSTSPTTTTNLPDIIDIPDDFENLVTAASASSSISSSSGRSSTADSSSARNHSISSASTTATTVDMTGWDNIIGFDNDSLSSSQNSNVRSFSQLSEGEAQGLYEDELEMETENRTVKRRRLNTGIRDCVIGDVKGKGKAVVIELD